MFNGIVKDTDDFVEAIELVSWHWSLSGLKTAACLFYDCVTCDTSLYSWHHECIFVKYVCILFFTFLFKLIYFELQIDRESQLQAHLVLWMEHGGTLGSKRTWIIGTI